MADKAGGSSKQSSSKSGGDLNSRFRALHQLRQEARKKNHEQVVEEDRRSKLPSNYESKRMRQDWELKELEEKKTAEEKGLDYNRLKALEMQADIVEKIDVARKRKKNPDTGFADYDAMTLRQHQRLTNGLKPEMESYKKMREVVGAEQFYPSANTLIQGSHYPTESAMERLIKDVDSQQKKREQYHRRRMFDPDAPIDYINEKNRKFNQKLDKFYGKYTEDIRDDIERGTAI